MSGLATDHWLLMTDHFALPKQPNHLPNPLRQNIDLLARVVQREGGADGGGNAESIHYRLGAVLAGSDGDTFLIENRSGVVRVDAIDYERKHARLPPRRADEAHFGDRLQRNRAVREKIGFVSGDHLHA